MSETTTEPKAKCPKCGQGIYPTFFSAGDFSGGGEHWVEFSCHKCSIAAMDSKCNRLFRVWQLSGLTDAEAVKLIESRDVCESIAGWFDRSTSHFASSGRSLYSMSDVLIDPELYGKAIAKLIAVGKKERGLAPPSSNVVPFRRQPLT